MTLEAVLAVLARLGSPAAVSGTVTPHSVLEIGGVSADSRGVEPGDLYAALPGSRHHGADFSVAAAAAGATAILTDPSGEPTALAAGLPVLTVPDPRGVLGPVAAAVHGHPDSRLLALGVTGTNGKTTVTYFLDSGLRAAGHRTGLVGTVETRVGHEVVASVRTTPEAPDVQRLLARMVGSACTAVSMEVSSHALVLGRVDGITFDVALFTNLSQDHLDFHETLEDYYQAKAQLFTPQHARHGVVDVDSAWGRRLALEVAIPVTTVSSGGGTGEGVADADWRAVDVRLGPEGSEFRAEGPSGESARVSLALQGPFNVANALGALATLVVAGVPLADAVRGIGELTGVPGRMERIDVGQPFLALVDYAHTPDAVETLLASVRSTVDGPLVVVLGCGGDRDSNKRPAMGAAAVVGADVVVLTSDNPRSEDPRSILDAMRSGAEAALESRSGTALLVEVDRAEALALAVERARPGGAIVVAGKGHESGQEIAGEVFPFDDREVLRRLLVAWVSERSDP